MGGFASRQCEQEHFFPELLLVSFTDGAGLRAQCCWVWDSTGAVRVLGPSPFVAWGLCYARQFSNVFSHENTFSRYIWWELPRTLRADRNVIKCPEVQICGHLFLPLPNSLFWEGLRDGCSIHLTWSLQDDPRVSLQVFSWLYSALFKARLFQRVFYLVDCALVKSYPLPECLERRTDVQSGSTGEVTALKLLQWDLIQTSLGSVPTLSLKSRAGNPSTGLLQEIQRVWIVSFKMKNSLCYGASWVILLAGRQDKRSLGSASGQDIVMVATSNTSSEPASF